jgi:hypothetical protein
MKLFLLVVLCAMTAMLDACVQRPLTDTEFRGFCYTSIGRRNSCDTITICDDFDNNVLSEKHLSRKDCREKCTAVYNRLYTPNLFEGCSPTVLMAYNWCEKYCNTNYPE